MWYNATSLGFGIVRLYGPYINNEDILWCPSGQGYSYNQHLTGVLSGTFTACNNQVQMQSFIRYEGRRNEATIPYPDKTVVTLCTYRKRGDSKSLPKGIGSGWMADDACDPTRQFNYHMDGANYALLDGHVKWMRPAAVPKSTDPYGKYLYCAYEGLDYDGDGVLGGNGILR